MATHNFYTLMNRYGLNTGNVVIHYDFVTPETGYVLNVAPSNGNQLGLIKLYKPEFWDFPDSGNFSCGTYVDTDPTNFTYYAPTNFTKIFCLERDIRTGIYPRQAATNATIFSSIGSGISGIQSGYAFGLTAINQLFFKCFDTSGNKYFWTSNKQYGDRNILAITKYGPNFNFLVYNTGEFGFDAEAFNIQGSLAYSKSFSLGYAYDTGRVGGFDGKMDEFVFIRNYIDLGGLDYIISGFFINYTAPYQTGVLVTTTGITGYLTIPVYQNVVTGYTATVTGSETDDCGNLFSGYGLTPATGSQFSGYVRQQQTGIISYFQTVTTGESYILNTGYLSGIVSGEVSTFSGFSGFPDCDVVYNNYDTYFNLG